MPLSSATKGLAYRLLNEFEPIYSDNYERFGFNKIVNEASAMK